MEIDVVPYDDDWPRHFERERSALAVALEPWLFGGVEHVGSTAVPGMAAKPVIDMLAGVRDVEQARDAVPVLADLGYAHAEHRPQALWFFKPVGGYPQRTHHLHLTRVAGDLWRERIAFRDALRADPALAASYQGLKLRLAVRHQTVAEYTQGKRAFVAEVLADVGLHLL